MKQSPSIPKYTLEEAVERFLKIFRAYNTKKAYRNAFMRLIKYQIFEKEAPLKEALQLLPNALLAQLKQTTLSASTQNQCLYFYQSFRSHWLKKKSESEDKKKSSAPYRRQDTITRTLSAKKFREFLPFLKKVNRVHALAAEIYKNLNRQLNSCRIPIKNRMYISLREILQLTIYDLHNPLIIELFRPKQRVCFAAFLPLPKLCQART